MSYNCIILEHIYFNWVALKTQVLTIDIGSAVENATIVAHALTRYAGEFTFIGETGTKTPISIQLKPDRNEIKITHAGQIILGKCGEVM